MTDLILRIVDAPYSKKIEGFAFQWFPSLRHLEVQNAQIDLSNEAFCGLHKLETLTLKQTMLTSIPALQAFGQTGSLKTLDLSGNSLICQFPPDVFASVTSRKHLDLSYNLISYLNKWFESLINLTHLFLNGGNIQFLSAALWDQPLYSLIEVHLDHLMSDSVTKLGD